MHVGQYAEQWFDCGRPESIEYLGQPALVHFTGQVEGDKDRDNRPGLTEVGQ